MMNFEHWVVLFRQLKLHSDSFPGIKSVFLSTLILFIVFEKGAAQYCAAGSTSPELYESVTNVTFGGLNNTSPVVKTQGYTDYTALSPVIVVPGQSYPISVTVAFQSGQFSGFCKVYLDFNQNNTFDTPGELVFESAYTGNMVMSGTVAVPTGATLGTTRMRVVLKGDGTAANTVSCGSFSWGEVEDYSVYLCNQPEQPILSASSSTICIGGSATLSIASGNLNDADNWQWYSGSCGGTQEGQGSSVVVSPTVTTTYYARGEGTCGGTLCGSITITVQPIPVSILSGTTEGCNGSSANISVDLTGTPPWSVTYTDGTTPVIINNILSSPYQISVSPTTTTTYTLTAFSDAHCSGTTAGSATVIVDGDVLYTPGNDAAICEGETAELKVTLNDKSTLFNGSSGRINIPNSADINTTATLERTVAFWFYANDVTARQMLYEEGAQVNGFSVYVEGGFVYVHAWESNITWGVVRTAVNTGNWYHVAFVFDSSAPDSEYFKGYLNGVYIGGNSNVAAVNGMNAHTGDVYIGRNGGNTRFTDNSTNSGAYYFNGYIDEFKLWNRPLTAKELLSERWNVNDGTQSGANLIVYYSFNNDTPTTVTDLTGGNNGIITGGVSIETQTPFTPTILWSPGGMTGFTENVSPVTTTVYSFTLTHPFNNCETTGTITVTVNSPSASVVSNNSPVCSGEDVVFNLSGTSGSTVTYQINGGSGSTVVLTDGNAFITVSGVSADQALTLLSVGDGTCTRSLSETSTVTVNPLPATSEITTY